ncbi:hypothetical protein [Emcibacter nanhaiensis]|uniref:PepSY domain-containing protein n=1 Tax=Emcibacter nanhaiensis TaxID=1505037 RepID=A0A501PNE3_9PROT|nr:hypothetical protein [Emcibacter nanhaiensis]TPD61617.1 hypothetical protein FIV46_05250 [Emcibacter nanhaiensis]
MRRLTRSVATLALLLAALASLPSPATAADLPPAGDQLSAEEAQQQARRFMREIGYSIAGHTLFSAKIGDAELQNDLWVVQVEYGSRYGMRQGVVLVDATDGSIRKNTQ